MKAAFLRGRGLTRRRKAQLGCVLGTVPWHATLTLRVIAARTGRGRCAGLLTFFVKRFTISETGVELSSGLFVDRWECVPPANGRLLCAGNIFCRPRLLAPPVRLWSMKAAVAWLYSSLGSQPEIKRLFIESELFPWIFTARSTLYLVLLFASTSLSCRSRVMVVLFTLFKLAFRRNFASN
jgi:hypothetical protein